MSEHGGHEVRWVEDLWVCCACSFVTGSDDLAQAHAEPTVDLDVVWAAFAAVSEAYV